MTTCSYLELDKTGHSLHRCMGCSSFFIDTGTHVHHTRLHVLTQQTRCSYTIIQLGLDININEHVTVKETRK